MEYSKAEKVGLIFLIGILIIAITSILIRIGIYKIHVSEEKLILAGEVSIILIVVVLLIIFYKHKKGWNRFLEDI